MKIWEELIWRWALQKNGPSQNQANTPKLTHNQTDYYKSQLKLSSKQVPKFILRIHRNTYLAYLQFETGKPRSYIPLVSLRRFEFSSKINVKTKNAIVAAWKTAPLFFLLCFSFYFTVLALDFWSFVNVCSRLQSRMMNLIKPIWVYLNPEMK